VSDSLD